MALEILTWLIKNKESSITIVLLTLGFILQYRYFIKVVSDKDLLISKKDEAILNQSIKVIKLATLWEEKSDNNIEAVKENNRLLVSIREALISAGIIKP